MLLLLCAGLFSWLLLKFMNDDAQRRLEHREATEKACQAEDEVPDQEIIPKNNEPCTVPQESAPGPVEHTPCPRVEPVRCYEPTVTPKPEPEIHQTSKPAEEKQEPVEITYPMHEDEKPVCCPDPEKKVEEPTVTQPLLREPEVDPKPHVEPEEVFQQEYQKPLEHCPVVSRHDPEPEAPECEAVQQPQYYPEVIYEPYYRKPLECCEHQEAPIPEKEEPKMIPEVEVFEELNYHEPEEYCKFIPQKDAPKPVPRERTTQPEAWSTSSDSGSEYSTSSSNRSSAHEGYKKVLEELREKHCDRPEVMEILTLTRDIRNSVSTESDLSSCSSSSTTDSESDSEDDRVIYSFRKSPEPKNLEGALQSQIEYPSEDEMVSCEEESDDEDIVIEFRKAEILMREGELDANNNVPNKAVDPVFVAPPPPHQEMEKLPFICRLNKTVSADEYGFNLHAEKNRGHFIGAVDHGGIGDEAGLKMGQRIVGVNDVLIHPNTPYKEVVSIIKKSPMSTTLLVAPEDVDKWYKANNQSYSWDHAIEGKTVNGNHIEQEIIHEEDKQFSPHSIQISDEEIHVESPIPPKYDVPPPIEDDHLASHMVSAQYDLPPMDNTTPAIDSSNILDAVFGGLPASETLALAPQLEEYNHHVEVPEPVEQKELIQHPGHEHHEEETPIVDDRHANYNPYNAYQDVSQASPVSNGSSSQSSQGSLSPGRGGEDYGIYGLSAKQARERLRQQKPRAATMSLEEKYRLVSNM